MSLKPAGTTVTPLPPVCAFPASRHRPPCPQPCPCPSRALCSQSLCPLLPPASRNLRQNLSSGYSTRHNPKNGVTESPRVPPVPAKLGLCSQYNIPTSPGHVHMCFPSGPSSKHLPSPQQDPDFILFHPSPLPLPTELTPPMSLSFKATRNEGLIH